MAGFIAAVRAGACRGEYFRGWKQKSQSPWHGD
jgi:hypothetical protein